MPFRASWHRLQRWFVHLLHLDETAHQIALGAAIGTFVSFTPTVGLQMLLIFFITGLFRANRVAGVPMAWVTNPVTIVPIYSFNYLLGHRIVGGADLSVEGFERAVRELVMADPEWWTLVKGWWDLAMQVAAPLWVGSVVVGMVAGGAAYGIMYGLISFYRRVHRRRRAAAEARARDESASDE